MRCDICDWDRTDCTAPNTSCPHWIGTFCELDISDGDINVSDKKDGKQE